MRRLFAMAVLLSGCTLVLAPDRDAIVRDLDAGLDGGDGGPDGGDGGDGGEMCVWRGQEDCSNGEDDDCDGRVDCFDTDCVGNDRCCRTGSTVERECLRSAVSFRRAPEAAATDIRFSDDLCTDESRLVEFGPARVTRALITETCQPINFGMRFETTFVIRSRCGTLCDHAALSFTPVQTIVDGEPLASELRVVVFSDGSARVERGGAVLRDGDEPASRPADHFVVGQPIHVRVELRPGPDQSGRDVLFATVDATQAGAGRPRLLSQRAVMPLVDLRCVRPSGNEPGLFAAIEGSGSGVEVVGPLAHIEDECSNPSQFRSQVGIDTSALTSCAPGGVGAPAVASYCRASCGSEAAQHQWDLWVDASELPRLDESYRFVDFGICGHVAERPRFPSGAPGDGWVPRAGPGYLWSIPPSSREPTLLPVYDDANAAVRVNYLFYAYAARMAPESEVHVIRGGQVFRDPLDRPSTAAARDILVPERAECASVRDPLLVARHEPSGSGYRVNGAWLFFTCERDGEHRSIGAAQLDSSLTLVDGTVRNDVLTHRIGAYARRGVFAPEGFSVPSANGTTLRLWFLARDDDGRVRLGFAEGRAPVVSDTLPTLGAYPANPILDAASPILGGDCSGGCALTGLSVTPSLAERGNYLFVVSRSRGADPGVVHELVPLLQPAPPDD